jgi:hypothetical protein
LRSPDRGGDRAYDLAILGSGFASYEIARLAVPRGWSVLILEKGAAEPDAADPAHSRVRFRREPIVSGGSEFGAQVPPGFESVPRYIGLGGTSVLWSGKWRRLDSIDLRRSFESRRWPISCAELDSHYDRVAFDYGWPDWSDDTGYMTARDAATSRELRLIEIYEETPPLRLPEKWAELSRSGTLEVLDSVQLLTAEMDPNGGLRCLQGHSRRGDVAVRARRFVIACGAIESVQVVSWLRTKAGMEKPRNFGGFMDHPKAFVGEATPCRSNLPLLEYLTGVRAESKRMLAFGLPEDELAAANRGNHMVYLSPSGPPRIGVPTRVAISLEQFPEAHNYVTTGPEPIVSWRISRNTRLDAESFLSTIAPRLEGLVGALRIFRSTTFRGASHSAGALPMGISRNAYVDSDCRVRGFENVYCVSSALFPVAGSASPTMTVVALARRLADHLHGSAEA